MNKYRVYVCLEGTYEIEADYDMDAFDIATEMAMDGGCWNYKIDTLEEDIEDEE